MPKSNDTGSAEHGRRVTEAVRSIQRAGHRGALSPASALKWARAIAAGETSAGYLDVLQAGTPDMAAKMRAEFAAAEGSLVSEVIRVLDSMRRSEPAPDSWPALFPPGSYAGEPTLGHLEEVPAGISDDEAADLFPPVSAAEFARREERRAAGEVIDYTDDELRAILFGDSSFGPEGGPENAA